jgi:hypothetical protein
MTPIEIRRQGLAAVHNELGYIGMVRFLNQSDAENGDYTKNRRQWQDGLTVADIVAQIKGAL